MENKKKHFVKIIISVIFGDDRADKLFELSKKFLIYALVVLFIFFALKYVYKLYENEIDGFVKSPFGNEKTIDFSDNQNLKVLILPFHDSNDLNSKFKIEEVIENGLSEEKGNYDLQIEVKIDSLSTSPKNFKEALNIGNSKNADFVIFGDLDSESKEYRINFVLTKKFYEFDVPIFIKDKHISEFKKNLQLSKIRSLEDEKFIIYNILRFSELKNGNCEKGIKLLNKAIQLTNELQNLDFTSEDNSYYAYYMSECYLEKQEFENALPILDFSLKVYPENYDSRIAKSIIHFLLGEFDKSKTEIDFLKTTDYYDKSSLYLASGFLNKINDKPELAYDEFDKSILLDNRDSIPSIANGIVDILKGNFADAIESTDKLKEYYDFEQPISNGVKSFVYFFDGNIQKSLNELSLLEKNIKNSDSEINFDVFRKGIERGYKLGAGDSYNKSELDSTYNTISRKISKDADQNIEDAFKMMALMKNKSDFKMISKHLQSAIKIKPEYANHYNFNNLKQEKVIELKGIINNYKDNLRFDNSDYILLAKLSNAYDSLGYGIISEYYKYKSINKDILALLYLKNDNLNKEKLTENKELLKFNDSIYRIDVSKTNSVAFFNRARAIHYLGFPEKALKDYNLLYEERPKSLNLLYELATAEFELKNYLKALEYDNKRILLDSLNPNNYWSRAAAYYYLKNYSNSLLDINKGIELIKKFDANNDNRIKEYSAFKADIETKIKTTPNTVYN